MPDKDKLSKSARRRKNKKRKQTEVTLEIQNMVSGLNFKVRKPKPGANDGKITK